MMMNDSGPVMPHERHAGVDQANAPVRGHSLPAWNAIKWLAAWVARLCALGILGFVAYFWCALGPTGLLRQDLTGLQPDEQGQVNFGMYVPIDHHATLLWSLGPMGWLVGLGAFTLALAMAWILHRWPWPLRVIVVTAPCALAMRQMMYVADLHAEIRALMGLFIPAEWVLAALAAALCRPIRKRVLRYLAAWPGIADGPEEARCTK